MPTVQTLVYRQPGFTPAPPNVAMQPTQSTQSKTAPPVPRRARAVIAIAAFVAVGGIAIALLARRSTAPAPVVPVVRDAAQVAVALDATIVVPISRDAADDDFDLPDVPDIDEATAGGMFGSDITAMYKHSMTQLCQPQVKIGDVHAKLLIDAMCACGQGDTKRWQELAARLSGRRARRHRPVLQDRAAALTTCRR